MLQTLRDNMKSAIFLVVVILFIVPMVLSGVGGGFLGTVAGTDAASVNGRSISKTELGREIEFQRQRILNQEGVDPTSDQLKPENLRGPVLERLTRRAALLSSSFDAGLGVAETTVNSRILEQESFFEDGEFSPQRYRRLLANVGFTPATFKRAIGEDIVLRQQQAGIQQSGFITSHESESFIALIKQKRSFDVVQLPGEDLADSIVIEESAIADYYNANQAQFVQQESARVEYLEISVNDFVGRVDASEEDVQALYALEVENAKTASPEVEVAHILIEDDGEAAAKLKAVQEALAQNQDFAELAKQYSDDLGSAENGGNLGFLTPGVFPEAFELAVEQLEQGQVSAAVQTDSGIHFIKVLNRKTVAIPTIEERRDFLEKQVAKGLAEEEFGRILEQLESLTYGADNLTDAADQLDLTVKTSESFGRFSGQGIAAEARVRDAAFSSDVMNDGRNSPVIELAENKAVVIRLLEHSPEQVKALEQVVDEIRTTLTEQAVNKALEEKAETIVARVKGGEMIADVAKDLGYSYTQYEDKERSAADVDYTIGQIAFSMPIQEEVAFDTGNTATGLALVALRSVTLGKPADMPEQQRIALAARLKSELANLDISSYESSVIDNADITLH